MKRITLIVVGLLLLAASALATQPSAKTLLANAEAQARSQHKNIFVVFDASW